MSAGEGPVPTDGQPAPRAAPGTQAQVPTAHCEDFSTTPALPLPSTTDTSLGFFLII